MSAKSRQNTAAPRRASSTSSAASAASASPSSARAAECVFSSDYEKFSQQTYEANFGERPHGDIHTVAVADIPAHDILCAGFPCQPFSIAGVSKKLSLGRKHGFEDKKQGNLFFSIADILDFHRPAAFVLENVKNLKRHDGGKTFEIIHDTLTEALGYTVYHQVIDAQSVVPQHRERIFFVGFREWRGFRVPAISRRRPEARQHPRTETRTRNTRSPTISGTTSRTTQRNIRRQATLLSINRRNAAPAKKICCRIKQGGISRCVC